MKVVFLQTLEGVAYAWDIKDVKPWFLRNFLLPKQIAVPASDKIIAETETLRKEQEKLRMERVEKANTDKAELEWKTIEFKVKTDKWHLYAAIWDEDIISKVKENFKIELAKNAVRHDKIKEVWTHEVKIHLAEWVDAIISVIVLSENEDLAELEKEKEAKKDKLVEQIEAEKWESKEENTDQIEVEDPKSKEENTEKSE